ncbi:uncharacterized protein LOC125216781 [Salvia hispanica]|uniref:uncharacterized protein LOC125216781 n=1 Tax=Salvia hispanica TaxID=49212 RepID=UPI002009B22F|nr:uncharacterized protein LOC125216781 [Salvia hispanica]
MGQPYSDRRINGLWINIDRCQKQRITCFDKGVDQFREFSNGKRLIKFLTGLNQEYDSIRRDILKDELSPSVEAAYGWMKKEATRRSINSSSPPTRDAHGRGADSSSGGGIRYGLAVQSQRPNHRGPPRPTAAAHRPGDRPDKSQLVCSHCAGN